MLIAVKCPSCNSNLQVPDDAEFVTCEYCQTVTKVRDIIRVETDYDVPEWLKIADNAYRGDNYDEAYQYYNMVLEKETNHSDAWIGKGLAAGRLSEESEPRFDEMLQLVSYGLNMKDSKNTDEQRAFAKKEMWDILQSYFTEYKKDRFDYKSDFDDYIKERRPFAQACFKCYDTYFSKDALYTKFFADVLKNFLYTGYVYDSDNRIKIEISEPLKTEYKNKLRALESELKAIDKSYVTYDEAKTKGTVKRLIITGSAILITALFVYYAVGYIKAALNKDKAKVTNEEIKPNNTPSVDYAIVGKSSKNKKIVYTIYTETTSLSDIQKFADGLISRDEGEAQSITIYFLSDKSEASGLAGKEISLKNTDKSMPDSFSARVKYTKGKDLKELHYYEKSKLTSETY